MSCNKHIPSALSRLSGDSGDSEAVSHWSHFRLRSFSTLRTTESAGIYLAAACLQVEHGNFGPTDPPEPESAFRVSVAMRNTRLKSLWLEDRWVSHLNHGRHSICIIDMERRPTVEFVDPVDLVQFYVPQRALRHFARHNSMPSVEGLRLPPPGSFDPVIANLACSLLPALRGAEQASGLFIDHIHLALQAHLLRKYAEIKMRIGRSRESLGPLQCRRAIELIEARISDDITLAELANELDLSTAHFARAFKNSLGETPYGWLTKRRIEHAKQLLAHTSLALADIALECGFSHRIGFARAFARITGVTPSEWRRSIRA